MFVVDKETGASFPAVLSMSKTGVKHAKRWNSMINQLKTQARDGRLITPPIFFKVYNLKAVPEANDEGQWFRWEVAFDDTETLKLPGGKELYLAAKEFHVSLTNGAFKVAEHTADGVETAAPKTAAEKEADPM